MRQQKLKMLVDPGPRMRESTLQAQIVAVLSGLGYTVMQAGLYRPATQCPECHERFTPAGANGSSPGIADLLVNRRVWGMALWAGLEVKKRTSTGKLSPVRVMQQLLADAGQNVIVASVADAVDAMQRIEAGLGFHHDRLEAFWVNNPRRHFE